MKVGEMIDHCKKLKDYNTPKKEYKKWTEVDEVTKLTKAMSDHVELADTALGVEKNKYWKEQKLVFLTMVKEKGNQAVMDVISAT